MCPPMPASPTAIGFLTDKELIVCLEKIINGFPLPSDVIADLNPYKYLPSNLPDGIWYFINSEDNKNMELGFWKAKGEACEILTDAAITGWRTTLEYYEGIPPHGRKTPWVMQEYGVTQKGLCKNINNKDPRSLCRLFRSDEHSPNLEMPAKHSGVDIGGRSFLCSTSSTLPTVDNATGQEKNGNDETRPLAVAERLLDPLVEHLAENNDVLDGDFLELDDLADPQSPSSSENSSCRTMSSGEYFDSLALLLDLDNGNQDQQGEDKSLKYSISAYIKSTEVIMSPATTGNLSAEGTLKSDYYLPDLAVEVNMDKLVLDHVVRCQQTNEVASSSQSAAGSSRSHKDAKGKEKKDSVGWMKKLKKKYFCLMPF